MGFAGRDEVGNSVMLKCPYGKPGDRLWVRESFTFLSLPYQGKNQATIQYAADGARRLVTLTDADVALFSRRKFPLRKTNARFMYRSCSRLTLELTGVRVDRLQDISADDARAEGCGDTSIQLTGKAATILSRRYDILAGDVPTRDELARGNYAGIWESINGPGSWALNPWVWAVGFRDAAT